MRNNPRKQHIIKAAHKRFARHGFLKTSMEEIARDLRIGKATLYHYFQSKEEIFYVVLESEIDKYCNDLKSIFSEPDSELSLKLLKYFEFKEKLQETYNLIYELFMLMIQQQPLEKEIQIFNNLLSNEGNVIQEFLSSQFDKKNLDKNLTELLVLQSWGMCLSSKLLIKPDEQLGNYVTTISKLIEKSFG